MGGEIGMVGELDVGLGNGEIVVGQGVGMVCGVVSRWLLAGGGYGRMGKSIEDMRGSHGSESSPSSPCQLLTAPTYILHSSRMHCYSDHTRGKEVCLHTPPGFAEPPLPLVLHERNWIPTRFPSIADSSLFTSALSFKIYPL